MAFVQTIWFKTSGIDDGDAEAHGRLGPAGASQTARVRGSKVLKDRDNENTFLVVAEFDSSEAGHGELCAAGDGLRSRSAWRR